MNVVDLIEQLSKLNPELPVCVGVGCSCYGTTIAEDVIVIENPSKFNSGQEVAFIE